MTAATVRRRPSAAPDPDGLGRYFATICRTELLSAHEERDLAVRSRAGDEAARQRLIGANLRLVVWVARNYLGKGLPIDDLVGEGNLGLLRAACHFDPDFGTRFSTYATWWIKQSIRQAIRRTGRSIRIPDYIVELMGRYHGKTVELTDRLGREPTFQEVVGALRKTEKIRKGKVVILAGALELAESMRRSDRCRFAPTLLSLPDHRRQPFADVAAADDVRVMLEALDRLDAREAFVLRQRFGIDGSQRTLKAIAKDMGTSAERARQIERLALTILRKELEKGHEDRDRIDQGADVD